MESFLILGFLVGMAHALEADHLAAVSTLALSRNGEDQAHSTSIWSIVRRGAAWGLGHTLTLFAICCAVLLLGMSLTEQLAAALELAVGVMLVILGIAIARRLVTRRIHFHAHTHDGQPRHIHAHAHEGEQRPHHQSSHDHAHPARFEMKALLIGLVHGAAGSAGLLALSVAATNSVWQALGYVLLFGIGSIVGMGTLSFVAAWPLQLAERSARWLHQGLTALSAAVAVVLGIGLILETAPLAMAG